MFTSIRPFHISMIVLLSFHLTMESAPRLRQEDNPGITVTRVDGMGGILISPTDGLITAENGSKDTFTMQLNSQPVSEVTINLDSSDPSEGRVSTNTLTFTPGNWNEPQTITIAGLDDTLVDGDQSYSIVTSPVTSLDPNYANLDPEDVRVVNQDLDRAGLTVSPSTALYTNEGGGSVNVLVTLTAQPTAVVTLTLSSTDESEGTVSPAQIAFSPDSLEWYLPQIVTVTGVDDFAEDEDVAYEIRLNELESVDENFNSIDPQDLLITNTDNDVAGITVQPTSGLITNEMGGSTYFTVVLNTKPFAEVTIPLHCTNETEGWLSTEALHFMPENWDIPIEVKLTGVNDNLDDGDIPYTITAGPAASQDGKYTGKKPVDVQATNLDNEEPPVAENDSYIGGQGSKLIIYSGEGLLANDRDKNGDPITAFKVSDPASGILILNSNGSFTYTPPSDIFTGTVTFSYQALDTLNLQSNVATVRIVIDERPVVDWVDPVENGGIYYLNNWDNQAQLKVVAEDNKSVDRVVFRRWDFKADGGKGDYVTLGTERIPPYQIMIGVDEIYLGWNEIVADAYDNENHISKQQHIWLFREKMTFLPSMNHSK